MEIVINIPEEDYEYLKSHNESGLYNAILNGTPLPKGHGRLVDADKLLKKKRCFEDFDGDVFNIIHEETVINAKTIIEADTTDHRFLGGLTT